MGIVVIAYGVLLWPESGWWTVAFMLPLITWTTHAAQFKIKCHKDLAYCQRLWKSCSTGLASLSPPVGNVTWMLLYGLECREEYVKNRVTKLVQELANLTKFAESELQAAYVAHVFGLSQKWWYTQSTVHNISHLFLPLESAISQMFVPRIVGCQCSELEENIWSACLPWWS